MFLEKMKVYLRTLRAGMLSWPFLLLFSFAAISFYFQICFNLDGASFSLNNFLLGTFVNQHDFSRLAAIAGTHLPSLIYHWLGGTDFKTFSIFFNFGHNIHIFFPFLLLMSIRYREPDLTEWTKETLSYYVLSLLAYRSFCYLFLISEMNFSHTICWLVVIIFRSRSLSENFAEKKDDLLWTFSLITLFAYPLAFFTFGFLAYSQTFNDIDKPNAKRSDWRKFFVILAILNFLMSLYYQKIFKDGGSIFQELSYLQGHTSALVIFTMFSLFIFLRPLFHYQNYILAALFICIYYIQHLFIPWHSFVGRSYALIFLICAFGFYIFLLHKVPPRIKTLTHVQGAIPFCLIVLAISFYQGSHTRTHQNKIMTILENHDGLIPYDTANSYIFPNMTYFQTDWNIQSLSIILQLKKSNSFKAVIESQDGKKDGLMHYLREAKLTNKFDLMNVQYPKDIFEKGAIQKSMSQNDLLSK